MRKRKAISLIKRILIEIEDKSNHNYIWMGKAKGFVANIFGKNSFQYDRFYRASFNEDNEKYNKEIKEKLIKVLNDGIDTIKHFGAYKEPKPNFLARIPNWLLGILITGLFTLAIMIGQILSDRQNFDLKQENKELKERLSSIPSKSISDKKENKSSQPNNQ